MPRSVPTPSDFRYTINWCTGHTEIGLVHTACISWRAWIPPDTDDEDDCADPACMCEMRPVISQMHSVVARFCVGPSSSDGRRRCSVSLWTGATDHTPLQYIGTPIDIHNEAEICRGEMTWYKFRPMYVPDPDPEIDDRINIFPGLAFWITMTKDRLIIAPLIMVPLAQMTIVKQSEELYYPPMLANEAEDLGIPSKPMERSCPSPSSLNVSGKRGEKKAGDVGTRGRSKRLRNS